MQKVALFWDPDVGLSTVLLEPKTAWDPCSRPAGLKVEPCRPQEDKIAAISLAVNPSWTRYPQPRFQETGVTGTSVTRILAAGYAKHRSRGASDRHNFGELTAYLDDDLSSLAEVEFTRHVGDPLPIHVDGALTK